MKIMDYLYCKDLYLPIVNKGVKPSQMKDEEWDPINRKATAHIRKWIDVSVINNVSEEDDAYTVWTKLEELLAKKNAQNKAFTIRKLVNLKYKEGQDASEHINNFQGLVNQLNTMKLQLTDEVQALILLGSLPDSWNTLVVSLSNSTPDGNLTLQGVKDNILNEETRRKEQVAISSSSEALVTERWGRSKSRTPKFSDRKGKGKLKGRSQSRATIKCFYCNKPTYRLHTAMISYQKMA